MNLKEVEKCMDDFAKMTVLITLQQKPEMQHKLCVLAEREVKNLCDDIQKHGIEGCSPSKASNIYRKTVDLQKKFQALKEDLEFLKTIDNIIDRFG
jgi:hypothetical protein